MSEKKSRLIFFLLLFFSRFEMRDDGPTYNVLDVWKMGLTGKGIVVAVVDQGLEKNHPELKQNYVSVRTFFSTIHLMSCFNNFDIDHVYEVFSKTDLLGKLCIKKRLSLVDFFEAFLSIRSFSVHVEIH